MIRRTFLKWCSSAAVVALVTTQGFRGQALGEPLAHEPVVRVETGISEVLQALNQWNEERWRLHGGVVNEDGRHLIWNAERREFNKVPAWTDRHEVVGDGFSITAMHQQGPKVPTTLEQAMNAAVQAQGKVRGRVTRRSIIDSFLR